MSLPLQQVLGSDIFVGRLAFREDAAYRAYADKVLQWEQNPSSETQARAMFFTVHDGSAATTIGYRALMRPVMADCRTRQASGIFPARDILELGQDGIAKDMLLDTLAQPGPAVLFTISHGLGAPRGGWRSHDEQRAVQGAMSLATERLAAEDIGSKPFLPGGMWFFLACYGGATPSGSAYVHWLSRLREARGMSASVGSVLDSLPKDGGRPFVAALPQVVLANPGGPLAVMAHADLAWTYSFQDPGAHARGRPSRFQGIFQSIVDGARAGVAYHELLRFFGEANSHLSTLYDQDEHAELAKRLQLAAPAGEGQVEGGEGLVAEQNTRAIARANLWMLRNDLLGYILLGDPAVRLPLSTQTRTEPVQTPAQSRQSRAASVLGFSPVQSEMAKADRARPEAAVMEEAVLSVLRGSASQRVIAARAGTTEVELSRWVETYKAAGRAALSNLE